MNLAFKVVWQQPIPVNTITPAGKLAFDLPLGVLIKKSDAAFMNAEQVETKALMLSGTATEGDMFVVHSDTVAANNGYYEYKNGAYVQTIYPNTLIDAARVQATNAAATDATAKANAAQTAAIAAAATDATNKANAAQTAAVSAAATDATSKANAAETNAKGYADVNALFKPVTLSTGQYTNIDLIVTSGHYIIDNNTIAAAITGLPEARAGFIDVIAKNGFVTQEYKPSASNYRYVRTSSVAGIFPAFEKILGRTYINDTVATAKQQVQDDLTVEGSENLFNPATVRIGYRLSGSGVVSQVTDAQCSEYIPIDGGSVITISATAKPTGVAFYTDRGTVPVLYSAASLNPQTITAPVAARFMVVNVKRESDPAPAVNLQVEKGSTATAYTIYSAKPVARQSTIPVNVVTTDTAAVASAKPYDIISASKNIFNETNIVDNNYLTNTGGTSGSTGWRRSGMIAVTPGQTYTLSGSRGRQGISGFANSTDTTATFYISDASMPITFTVPTGTNFVAFNLWQPSNQAYSSIQLETGSAATAYIPFGQSSFKIDGSAILNVPAPTVVALGTFTGGATQQQIKGVQGSDTVLHTVTVTAAPSHAGSRVFNWINTALNGTVLHTCGDDSAPARVNETTLGGNHGYSRSILTASSHGKVLADVGSVWKDVANKEWVIVSIDSVSTLGITARTDNTAISGTSGALIHVSGAANTATINWTAKSAQQWYPMLKNHKISVTADGKPIDPTSSTSVQFDKLVIAQSYELMPKNNMVEWLIANKGSTTDFTEYSAASNIAISMAYIFDRYGSCCFVPNLAALDTVPLTIGTSAPVMFHQTARLTPGVDGNVKYIMPNALPVTHDGVTYDFAAGADMSSYAPAVSNRLQMTLDKIASGKSIDRVIQLTDNWFYASGFLPVMDGAQAARRTLASNKSLELNNTQAKIYFSAFDNGTTQMNAGEVRGVIAYRVYGRRPTNRLDNYTVSSPQGDYFYADWQTATIDRVALPPNLHGRAFTEIDKSSTVQVFGTSATDSLLVKTTGAGQLILKFL